MILRRFYFAITFVFIIFLFSFNQIFAAPSYTYTGSSTLVNDGNGLYRIKFLTSGTFTPANNMTIDVFLVGGGSSYGGSGYTKTYNTISLIGGTSYPITVGAGGAIGANGTASTAFGKTANPGSGCNGGSGCGESGYTWNGGAGGSDGSGGTSTGTASEGTGQGITTREFEDSAGALYAGAGGGGAGFSSGYSFTGGAGGAGGGGRGAGSSYVAYDGTANTGGGAGLGIRGTTSKAGGSGIVIIRFIETATSFYSYTGSNTLINDGNGNYRIKFLSSGTFTPANNMTADVFLVGGGSSFGGSGYTKTYTSISLTGGTNYSITVGAGGAIGANGTASTAFGKTANPGNGLNGGSGAGASGYTWSGGNGGSDGSKGFGEYNGSVAGTGQGTTTREFGESTGTLYAGGGGGGAGMLSGYTFTGGAGGAGGGGRGAGTSYAATNGTVNTGGGAGLGIRGYAAKAGGSGIIVIRFTDSTAPTCGTWSPTSSPWKNAGASTFTLSGSTDTGGSGISTAGGSCTTGSTNGATCTVTISDVAGNTRVCTSPVNNIDAIAPSGGSISYSATTITSSTQSLSITVADGTDSLAGINTDTRQLLRQEAIYDGSSCGSYGNPYPVSYSGTYPNITTSNFDLNRCYKYFWRIADNANNNTFYSSSNVVTATNANLSLQTRTLGSIITINNLPFTKVTETGLLVALEEHPFVTTTTFPYTGAAQTFTVPRSGWYQIEAWGAAGGDARIVNGALVPNSGGQGGYTSGKIYLTAGTVLTIQVGGKGGDQDSTVAQSYGAGGYNGGGNGGTELNTETSPEAGAGGGGATDIRLVGGSWNDITSLRSRIMVTAGGGGAASHISGATYPEAYGGSAATLVGSSISSLTTGGTQISGGAFGIGKAGFSDSSGSNYGAYGGGGGGYYGGSWSTNNSSSVAHGGASGSSFISGYAGVNTVTSASSTTATYTTLHYSNQYFRDSIIKGEERSGNGQAKISYLGNSLIRINNNLNNVRYIKDCVNGNSVNTANQWSEIQAIKNGINLAKEKLVIGSSLIHSSTNSRDYATIVNGLIWSSGTDLAQSSGGGLQCVTVDLGQTYDLDEIAVWHYSLDGRTYNDNVTYVSTNNSTWTTVISITEPETANGKRVSAYRNSINMTNQVNNGRFNSSTVTGWSTSGTSVTNTVNGTISPLGLYINDTSSTGGFWNYYATSLVSGNIYYAAQKIYINSQSAGGISIGFRDSTGAFVSSYSPSSSNGFERVSRRVAAGSNWTHLQVGTAGAAIVSGYIKEVMLINLTAVFGAGNEPTQEWCDENIPFFEGTALIYYP